MDKITNKITVVFALLLLAGLGAFGFFKVTAYLDLYNYNKDMKAAITDAKTDSSDLASEITEAKLLFQETNSVKNDNLASVFPASEDLTSLTRAFDEFSTENNFSNSPFFISSISYQDSEASIDGAYMILPFTIKVESSKDNFYEFLDYIGSSGNLDSGIRLMDITNVSSTFVEDENDNISFSLSVNAYFQK
ncbi:MAG: hypothetical protein ACD_51C00107G0002 [uncultured bacterium]|nr:MAG: hypothetical protein ACD_51C00107G0002 [uncultured bacterium]OGJ48252.1 MAG: hypothetical protein A2244_04340 [Candidatus Peregrinibacteria bacterium RIFOXYA2_FULL_41_18]OGJ48803.1 MAG: hypothetical protein A2344_01595 [Candidatus Peregrinibacteria bacterium RIFOXYB12_FULL_41_12]OGJ52396.1 MAG: hypothetical protein A2336_05495 [Candidatus Peregrinibacteria bacterium RIFOXYB2_FULL_41_88]OGJ52862.1 MAG: hypothetical protein A2448_00775 [Candidatus Peregrinibacteria bacterium RIFOXYC2_FULL